MNNVAIITKKEMCCSCASCAEVCPKGAITYQLTNGIYCPIIDEQKCIDCGMCLKVCPAAIEEKLPIRLKSDIFDTKEKESYIAYCKDETVRHRSKSGGVVTTVVTKLLNDGLYEKAFLLEYEGTEGKASLSIFKKGDDIKRAANSKYIPVSVDKVIAAIRDNEIAKSIIVGTPCHMRAIKAAMQLYKRSEEDVLFIGLFCNQVFSYDVFGYYQHHYGKFDTFHFCDKECGGWPGGSWFVKEGKTGLIPRKVRMALRDYYTINKCRFCGNQMNLQADISLGDCYVTGKTSKLGKSSVVVRTRKGKAAFDYCKDEFVLENDTFANVKDSQHIERKMANMLRPMDAPFTREMLMSHDVTANGFDAIKKEVDQKTKPASKSSRIINRLKRIIPSSKKKNQFVVLINSGGFLNKGSDIMRRAAIEQIRLFKPNAIIAVRRYVWKQDAKECKNEGLKMLLDGRALKLVRKVVPLKLINKFVVTPQQVDVVLDASGFTYGDAWRTTAAMEEALYSQFTKKGRKIILLPQAFGPFSKPESIARIKVTNKYASIIYAREPVSMEILKGLFPKNNNILLAPDFTANLSARKKSPIDLKDKEYCLVILNQRMVDRAKADVASSYKQYMVDVIKFLLSKGEKVVLFNHEGDDDYKLMQELNHVFDDKLMMVNALDGLDTKTFIGHSKLLISSRFHGVVSGLCQQVPTFCTSWNHKYEELLKDYKCEGNILDVNNIEDTRKILTDVLANPDKYVAPTSAIEDIKNRTQQMWYDIFSYINGKDIIKA